MQEKLEKLFGPSLSPKKWKTEFDMMLLAGLPAILGILILLGGASLALMANQDMSSSSPPVIIRGFNLDLWLEHWLPYIMKGGAVLALALGLLIPYYSYRKLQRAGYYLNLLAYHQGASLTTPPDQIALDADDAELEGMASSVEGESC